MVGSDWQAQPVERPAPKVSTPNGAAKRSAKRARARKARRVARASERAGERGWKRAWRQTLRASILRVGKNLRPAVNGLLARYSEVGDTPTFDPTRFPWTAALERDWEAIRKEAEFVLRARADLPPLRTISPDHDRIDVDDRWKVFFLKGYGYWQERNCDQCPQTAERIRAIPGLETAFFSILEGGKHIPPHRGPTKSFLTFHLGLLVPRERESCWIELDRRLRASWRPGKLIAFDDTYRHEVFNGTAEDRVILLLHVRRPLRFPGDWIARAMCAAIRHSPFVQDGLENHRRWYAERADRERATRR